VSRNGGPLRRDTADRLAGGVASGVAAWRGVNVTTVRIVFVLIAVVSGGWFVPLYVLAWLLIPAAGAERSIGSKKGTGGSLGVEFLKKSLFHPIFPDLWAIRHKL